MNFQKVYMNQVYSSSMMGQVAHLWRNQLLCDAVIKTGNTNTKAHRLMLIAACPMLQHMENASVGSHLEVRLSADIKQSSVTTFLQYLYEGFMMLTEENCKDVEKIGKLLHVDSVVKCCVNFYKCLRKNNGPQDSHFDFQEKLDSDHVHTLDLFNVSQDKLYKRSADGYSSGSNKRQRSSFTSATSQNDTHDTDDRQSMTQSYSSVHSSYENSKNRTPRRKSLNSPQGVIELFEDSVEVVCTEPRERDSDGWPRESTLPPVQRRMSVAVSSKNSSDDAVQVINVSNASSPQIASEINSNISSARNTPDNIGRPFSNPNNQNMPRIDLISSSLENQTSLNFHSGPNWYDGSSHRPSGVPGRSDIVTSRQDRTSNIQTPVSAYSRVQHKSPTPQRSPTSPYTETRVPHQSKSFAAGSAVQVSASQSTGTEFSSSVSKDTNFQRSHQSYTSGNSHVTSSQQNIDVSTKPPSTQKSSFMSKDDQIPDMSTVIKIEDSSDTGGLDMSVDAHDNDKVEDELKESMSLEEAGDFFTDNSITEDGSSYTGHDQLSRDTEAYKDFQKLDISLKILSAPHLAPITVYPNKGEQELVVHSCAANDGKKQKVCHYCRSLGLKNDTGRPILTRHKCKTCAVPLCIVRDRNCFVNFHNAVYGSEMVTNKSFLSGQG